MQHGKHLITQPSSPGSVSPSQVSVVLSHLLTAVDICSTDLAEAQAVAARNIRFADVNRTNNAKVAFSELDWEQPLLRDRKLPSNSILQKSVVDLVIVADCTYNADSRLVFNLRAVQLMLIFFQAQHLLVPYTRLHCIRLVLQLPLP